MNNAETITVRQPQPDEMPAVLVLRNLVLNQSVGHPDQTELSTSDLKASTVHVAAFDGDHVVGTARFDAHEENGDTVCLVRRVATDPTRRRQGIGARVMQCGESIVHERFGARHFVLHAREEAVPFYESLGYTLTGKTAMHDGDENWEMTKMISSANREDNI